MKNNLIAKNIAFGKSASAKRKMKLAERSERFFLCKNQAAGLCLEVRSQSLEIRVRD